MRSKLAITIVLLACTACAGRGDRRTLSSLHVVEPDVEDVQVDVGLEKALAGYRQFLEEAPESALTPEAMRRLADLQLEREYGYLGAVQGQAMPSPRSTARSATTLAGGPGPAAPAPPGEADSAFERRAAGEIALAPASDAPLALPTGSGDRAEGPREAIALYDRILERYPDYPQNDRVLYQKARAYDELGETDAAIGVIEELIHRYPGSRAIDEAQFRRAEYFFTRRRYLDAEEAYLAVTRFGPESSYFELALYKLGWTFYKQDMHEQALDTYVRLLDHKVANGFDFDQGGAKAQEEADERRIADTFRVISLSFSSIGGSQAIAAYFERVGERSYEDRIYAHLGDFFLEKLRYHDAAEAYQHFVDLHPIHASSPRFSMKVVHIYEQGGFGALVLEAKKRFARSYARGSTYWAHFDPAQSPEILDDLRGNLEDLASHYHAMYQQTRRPEERPEHYAEALSWYGEYLESFPEHPEAPGINYQLADLHLEQEDFARAASEYEHTAYGYDEHERASEAGYAAIFAHRQLEAKTPSDTRTQVTTRAVESTLRFVERFPEHEHAAVVLGAAIEDLYKMERLEEAIAQAEYLIATYASAEPTIIEKTWITLAHALFDTEAYARSERAYAHVLSLISEERESRAGLVDNLAAAIYKQGEAARRVGEHRVAAEHFLRIRDSAPTSTVRPAAEFDAGTELIALEDWAEAATVLTGFRDAFPDHELASEATKQIAFVHRSAGEPARAAEEYVRVAGENDDREVVSEALLLAGELFEEASDAARALGVYQRYVKDFPAPLELAIETRFKVAELHGALGDAGSRRGELRTIVALDAEAGEARTPRIRNLAAKSALALTEQAYEAFRKVALVQPFETNLRKKQQRMNVAISEFGALVAYEVGEVTAAATFYIAEIYGEFSTALLESERPADLSDSELLDYELVLEEEAYPFEERAIEVHQKNLELMGIGVYNGWIDRSLARLADLVPGRYAKFEESVGPFETISLFAYLAPTVRETTAQVTPPEMPADAPPEAAEPSIQAPSAEPAPVPADLSAG